MEIRKIEAMLQGTNEKAEAERKSREEEKEAEKKDIMELRQATEALRKEKEAYESMYGHSELGSLRDDDSVRSNSLRRAMAGSSETSQELVAEVRAREVAQAQQANTRRTQEQAMPPPREFRGPWYVVTSREKSKNRDRA